MVAVGR